MNYFGLDAAIATFRPVFACRWIGQEPTRQSKPRSRHASCCGGGVRFAESVKIAPAGVAPVARAQVVRGTVARRSGLPSAARILATSSGPPAAPFAVQTRPPCAPLTLPGQPRPAGLVAPVPPFNSSLQSFRARPRAGIRSGVGVAWAQPLHLRWIVLGATPTPALRVFFMFSS